ncbi:MAG: hypothetical protein JSU68_04460 [Phycisphaerales bacterium]|nr:MAG: hypothetical protein JSU68_04460 [Phycisphaerales bacterium]
MNMHVAKYVALLATAIAFVVFSVLLDSVDGGSVLAPGWLAVLVLLVACIQLIRRAAAPAMQARAYSRIASFGLTLSAVAVLCVYLYVTAAYIGSIRHYYGTGVSHAHLATIANAAYVYAEEYTAFPSSLGEMLEIDYITEELLLSPNDRCAREDGQQNHDPPYSSYVYAPWPVSREGQYAVRDEDNCLILLYDREPWALPEIRMFPDRRRSVVFGILYPRALTEAEFVQAQVIDAALRQDLGWPPPPWHASESHDARQGPVPASADLAQRLRDAPPIPTTPYDEPGSEDAALAAIMADHGQYRVKALFRYYHEADTLEQIAAVVRAFIHEGRQALAAGRPQDAVRYALTGYLASAPDAVRLEALRLYVDAAPPDKSLRRLELIIHGRRNPWFLRHLPEMLRTIDHPRARELEAFFRDPPPLGVPEQ